LPLLQSHGLTAPACLRKPTLLGFVQVPLCRIPLLRPLQGDQGLLSACWSPNQHARSVLAVSLRLDGLLHSRVGGFIAPRSPALGFVAFPAATTFSLARARTVNTFPGDAAHTLQSFPLISSTNHVTTTGCPPVVPSGPKCNPPCRDTASRALHSASPKRSAVLLQVTRAARCQASRASRIPP